ncbi:GyrI-like domain-containing protein [Marinomonas mediterranea]|jgi:Uncharacterized protein conserved in bacteria|uniref:Transcription activator effector binding protein n=1 Tax=Marinomonas mediterranea (strain ATCC 700492 / JCM 21426 / NBRC 103028 / MMB-1) TaxID=717774 RepID=F2JXP4_MARM1|nr:GyrI-like domain-containing protein [Marinomonas mediterranea]ADZ93042.1 transcription activator effector binding protein [Marinomonas mediterranea MMB-1]WCN10951.1 AraC family transcriptional regulator [Marinomonas mediterranea]WCN15013.1 AraC family transcriptional regulator [Marinomonas mediterranea]WCN19057.1 AraC family transcriptional regulator [Marinomonas mediterranea MMB-1]
MQPVYLQEKQVNGLKVRTNNKAEMSSSGKIGGLWGTFFRQIAPHLTPNNPIYGVYCHYESDANGDFDVMAATDVDVVHWVTESDDTQSISIQRGAYLEFPAKGEMPQAVIEAWQAVWSYFEQSDCPYKRAYTTDFEHYQSEHTASVFIAIED